jgi:predicted enzyme related to lactoylglutathione lyase
MEKKKPGTILWHDLAVPDAGIVSDFYQKVIGWEKSGLSMGDYDDYVMQVPDGDSQTGTTGVCHAKGTNSYIPPYWMIYVAVENLDKSLEQCTENGGKVVGEKKKMGEDRYCLIQDPAGAYLMLYEQA